MKTEYTSRELRRLPGITYDTLRTWAGRRNTDEESGTGLRSSKHKGSSHQPVLLSPVRKPGATRCWIYGGDAVERIWQIRMLQMLGYKNGQIEEIFNAPDQESGAAIWNSLDEKINDLRWKIQHLSMAQRFAEVLRSARKLPDFPHDDGVDDIDKYLEVLPVDPKAASSRYEVGSKELMKANGIDKDAIIAQFNSQDLSDFRERFYLSAKNLWLRQVPADSAEVYSLIDIFYTKEYANHEGGLRLLHAAGALLAKQDDIGRSLDDTYGIGFSAFLAEGIFIYCFIQNHLLMPDDENP